MSIITVRYLIVVGLVCMKVIQRLKNPLYRILRWSEKYTKTDMVYLASGGFWLSVGQIISTLSILALAVAFANLVPPETYGTYKYLLAVAAIFSLFTLPGMNTAIARSVARGDRSTVRTATKMRIIWGLLGTIVAIAGGAYYFANGNVELAIALILIGAFLPIFDTYTLYNAYLTGIKNFKKQSLFYFVSQGLSTLLLITVLIFTNNVLLLLLAYFIPLTAIRFLFYKKTEKEFTFMAPDKETIRYGKHLSFLDIFGIVAGNIDKVLLWKFLGPTQLAIYAFAVAIPEQIKGPLKGVSSVALPKFATQAPEHVRLFFRSFWYKVGVYSFLLFIISLIYIGVAPLLFKVLFPSYLESVLYSQILALSLFTGAQSIPAALLSAHKRTRTQYILATTRAMIQIILLIVLVSQFGIMGVIIAIVVTNVFNFISTIVAVIFEPLWSSQK